ncbi:unnamed protein product [Protopolystoma xenopodis]|uniref:Uncharacterized protein n=1 Tax=Protopolystoma xenopodis TaxID=117903 RepID=A0A448WCE9_9PLAT|nr:unnamed protein product [Protopolystoma xenopodis]
MSPVLAVEGQPAWMSGYLTEGRCHLYKTIHVAVDYESPGKLSNTGQTTFRTSRGVSVEAPDRAKLKQSNLDHSGGGQKRADLRAKVSDYCTSGRLLLRLSADSIFPTHRKKDSTACLQSERTCRLRFGDFLSA